MRRALRLAERALGETNPNPAVGCVLVRRGVVVGEGFHARAGSPHAEAVALAAAGPRARGATAYVTLEPCAPNRRKRTPPCAPRLVAAGVRRVVFGVLDANPGVRGRGKRLLRAAGVKVEEGSLSPETTRLTQHFNTAMRRGRPYVCLKAGMTLDGRVATFRGESRWITSVLQRTAARKLRRLFDGIVVGIETAIADDPMLLPAPRTRRTFSRVILDSRLRLPPRSRLARSARLQPVIVLCVSASPKRRRALEAQGVSVVKVRAAGGRVSIPAALRALFARGITSLVVEGGSEVSGAFLRERAFDEIVMFRGPLVLGGRDSRPVFGGESPARLRAAMVVRRARPSDSATIHYGLGGAAGLEAEVFVPRPARPRRSD